MLHHVRSFFSLSNTPPSSLPVYKNTFIAMKPPTILATIITLTLTGLSVADKTCTPSFDYCSDVLLNSKGKPPSTI